MIITTLNELQILIVLDFNRYIKLKPMVERARKYALNGDLKLLPKSALDKWMDWTKDRGTDW